MNNIELKGFQFVLSINLAPVIGLILLLIFVSRNFMFNRKQSRFFLLAVAINILAFVAISTDFLIMVVKNSPLFWLRRITSFLNFALSPSIPFLLLYILAPKKPHWGFSIPLLINTVVCFVSMFVNTVFFIGQDNSYARGFLFYLPILTSVFYIVLMILNGLRMKYQGRRSEQAFLIIVILLLGGGMLLERIFNITFVMWNFTAVSLVLYYLLLNIRNITHDPLTNVYNRLYYQRKLAELEHKKNYFFAELDINDFKKVNDEFGHDAGDRALIKFADILVEHLSPVSPIYRIGGDEFCCIGYIRNLSKFEKALEVAREYASKFGIAFSCGIAVSEDNCNTEEIIRRADRKMYRQKAEMKTEGKQ